MDHVGLDVDDLKKIIAELNGKDVDVHLLQDGLRFVARRSESDHATLMVMLHLCGVTEFERVRIEERQLEGIAVAKQKGVYEKAPRLKAEQVMDARQHIEEGVPKAKVAQVPRRRPRGSRR